MTPKRKCLWKGALKTAVTATLGVCTGLPTIAPATFNFSSMGGVGRLVGFTLWTIFVAELRYIDQWLDSGDDSEDPPAPMLPPAFQGGTK